MLPVLLWKFSLHKGTRAQVANMDRSAFATPVCLGHSPDRILIASDSGGDHGLHFGLHLSTGMALSLCGLLWGRARGPLGLSLLLSDGLILRSAVPFRHILPSIFARHVVMGPRERVCHFTRGKTEVVFSPPVTSEGNAWPHSVLSEGRSAPRSILVARIAGLRHRL